MGGKPPASLLNSDAMNEDITYTIGQIVLHKGAPAMVASISEGRPTITLKLAKNHYKTVLKTDVQPYEGEGDAVSLGFSNEG